MTDVQTRKREQRDVETEIQSRHSFGKKKAATAKLYRLKKRFVLPAGTVFSTGPVKTEYPNGGCFQGIIGLSDDACIDIRVHEDDIKEMKDLFEPIN